MIDKQYGKYVFICDDCDDFLDTDERDFRLAVSVAKSSNWLITKDDDDEWQHICPRCCK